LNKRQDLRKGLGLRCLALDSPLEMENSEKEAGVSAAAAANVESVPGSSNGNGHGFVPLVTVVGFHHAR
jgi:hypothetical protein